MLSSYFSASGDHPVEELELEDEEMEFFDSRTYLLLRSVDPKKLQSKLLINVNLINVLLLLLPMTWSFFSLGYTAGMGLFTGPENGWDHCLNFSNIYTGEQ